MTGIARYGTGGPAPSGFYADEHPFQDAGNAIHVLAMAYGSGLALGWERFIIGPQTHKLTSQPEAMQMIGVCRWLAGFYGCRVLPPAQQHSPTKTEQAALRAIGWWVAGKDDAQSAACHMYRWMKARNELPPAVRQALPKG
jgi:hypothetical protein